MTTIDALTKRLERAASLAKVDAGVTDWEVGQAIMQEASETLRCKLAIVANESLSDDQRTAMVNAINQDREANKTPEQRKRERLYWRKHPCDGARDALLAKLDGMARSNGDAVEDEPVFS